LGLAGVERVAGLGEQPPGVLRAGEFDALGQRQRLADAAGPRVERAVDGRGGRISGTLTIVET